MRNLLTFLLLCGIGWAQHAGKMGGNGQTGKFSPTAIAVSPGNSGTSIGSTVQFNALASDAFGNDGVVCLSSGWTSTSPGVATINSVGLATGVGAGTTNIQCAVGAVTGFAILTVETAPSFTNPPTPCTQPCSLNSGLLNQAYTNTLTASGGTPPYIFSLTVGSLPSGLGLSSAGLISGTPVSVGTSTFTAQVCDSFSACNSLQISLSIGTVGYSAYTGNAIVTPWPTIPNMGGATRNNAVWTDTSYPSGVASNVIRCTDGAETTPLTNHTFTAGYGGSGDALQLFNADDTLIHVNVIAGGPSGNAIIPILGSGQCGTVITADKNQTNPGSATLAFNFFDGTFDWTNRNLWYAYNNSLVQTFTFTNVVTGTFTGPVTFADMTLGMPMGANAPAWQSGHAYTTGQYVSFTGTYPDWQASHIYSPGDIILPSVNNPFGCAFKMSQSTAQTSGPSAPVFDTSGQGSCVQPSSQVITDGTAKWRNLAGPGTFTYQLTSSGGTSGVSFSLPAHPQILSTVSDNGLTWTNTGTATLPGWSSYGGISRNSTRVCGGFSNNGYAYNNNFTAYNSEQDTGIWSVCYDSALNKYHLLNTATGIMSTTTCSGGSGFNCAGGTISMAADGTMTAFSGCGFFIHNDKGSMNSDYQLVGTRASLATNTCGSLVAVVWRPFDVFNVTTSAQHFASNFSHAALGVSHVTDLFSSNTSLYGVHSGMMGLLYDLTSPGTTPPINLQNSPCANPFVSGNPPPCDSFYWDQHFGWAYHPDSSDTQPACGTVYNLQTLSPIPITQWQGEEICISTTPTWTNIATPGAQTVWRFAHTLATGANTNFDVQFQISSMSGTGKKLAFTSDWGCTLGSTDGLTTVCGAPWLSGFAYHLNDLVAPIGIASGSGAIYDVFKVTNIGSGTSGTSFPGFTKVSSAWASCTNIPGCTVTDSNGVVYQDVNGNPSNARGDVFIVQLAP